MENSSIFAPSHETPSLDETRRLANARMYAVVREKIYDFYDCLERPHLGWKFGSSMGTLDRSLSKSGLGFIMFPSAILAIGTDRNLKIVEENQRLENFGCFALTEVSHGSNALGVRTTATYDPPTRSFILETPDFEAAKCWIGNLGKTATHAVLYAQLYTADKVCHGLNAFVVPIRDPRTMLAFPGVVVGDLGEKVGLNGIDNGFGESLSG